MARRHGLYSSEMCGGSPHAPFIPPDAARPSGTPRPPRAQAPELLLLALETLQPSDSSGTGGVARGQHLRQ